MDHEPCARHGWRAARTAADRHSPRKHRRRAPMVRGIPAQRAAVECAGDPGVMTTAPLPRLADYSLSVIWSTGTDANTSAYDEPSYSTPPGLLVDGIGRAQQRAFAPPGTPALDVTLPNYDGRYSPGGALGPFVGRGPASTVVVDFGMDVLGDADDVDG